MHTSFWCGECRARLPEARKVCHKDFPYLLGGAAPYSDERIRALVHGLKFQFIRDAAHPLGNLVAKYLSQFADRWQSFTIVPIPLSPRRERTRGFNQSRLIAEVVAERLHLPISDALRRTRHTAPQSELENYDARRANVEGCFAVNNPDTVKGKHIMFIDDVATSGTTFLEATRALKAAGAQGTVAVAAALA